MATDENDQLPVRKLLRNRLRHWATRHRQGHAGHVFIFSVPRSGSTWLAELIATQGRFKLVNEPFNLRIPVVRDNLGINDWSMLLDDAGKPAMRAYLQRFIDDLDTDLRFKRENPFSEYWHFTTDRVLFKILFAGEDDFGWFPRNLGGKVVFLLRHPVPVSLSRQELPRIQALLKQPFARFFTAAQLAHAQSVIASGDRFQTAVVDWCLQNSVPLRQRDPDWLILSYEQMVVDPQTVVNHLSRHLTLPQPQLMLDRISRASSSSSKSSQESRAVLHDGEHDHTMRQALVGRWRSRIKPGQESQAFDTLEAFGIDYYPRGSTMPAPHYLLRTKSV